MDITTRQIPRVSFRPDALRTAPWGWGVREPMTGLIQKRLLSLLLRESRVAIPFTQLSQAGVLTRYCRRVTPDKPTPLVYDLLGKKRLRKHIWQAHLLCPLGTVVEWRPLA